MSGESPLRRLYNFFQRRYVLTAAIIMLPSFSSATIRTVGSTLGIANDGGQLTRFGNFVFWPIWAAAFLFSVLKLRADYYDSRAKVEGHVVLQKLLDGVNSVTKAKLSRFVQFIGGVDDTSGTTTSRFLQITQPKIQLDKILENIQTTLSQLVDVNRDDVGISLIVQPKGTQAWQWLSLVNVDPDVDIQALLNNPWSSARQVIDRKRASLFYADKRVARDHNEYVSGPRDQAFGHIGSVVVRDVSIQHGDRVFLRGILSITTHGRQLCDQDDFETERKICQLMLPSFESRIRLELCLLYIKEHMQDPASSSPTLSSASG